MLGNDAAETGQWLARPGTSSARATCPHRSRARFRPPLGSASTMRRRAAYGGTSSAASIVRGFPRSVAGYAAEVSRLGRRFRRWVCSMTRRNPCSPRSGSALFTIPGRPTTTSRSATSRVFAAQVAARNDLLAAPQFIAIALARPTATSSGLDFDGCLSEGRSRDEVGADACAHRGRRCECRRR
jgi:hypothetical protein